MIGLNWPVAELTKIVNLAAIEILQATTVKTLGLGMVMLNICLEIELLITTAYGNQFVTNVMKFQEVEIAGLNLNVVLMLFVLQLNILALTAIINQLFGMKNQFLTTEEIVLLSTIRFSWLIFGLLLFQDKMLLGQFGNAAEIAEMSKTAPMLLHGYLEIITETKCMLFISEDFGFQDGGLTENQDFAETGSKLNVVQELINVHQFQEDTVLLLVMTLVNTTELTDINKTIMFYSHSDYGKLPEILLVNYPMKIMEHGLLSNAVPIIVTQQTVLTHQHLLVTMY